MDTVYPISDVAIPEMALSRGKSAQAESVRPVEQQASGSGKSPVPNMGMLAKDLNEAVKMFNTNLSFSVDKDTGKTVIKVVDSNTKEVLRQIPPEDALRVAAHLKELIGILYDHKR